MRPARMTSTRPRPRRRRGRRVLLAVAMVGLVIGIVAWSTRDPSPVGHFRSSEGAAAYASSYALAMALLPAPAQTLDLETDFGQVRVYRFGPDPATTDRTPVLMLPGRTSGVPMWSLNLPDFAAVRTTYALDALGDAGMSVQTRPIESSEDQAAWIDQVVAQLPTPTVHLVGHSFGGWLAANYATHHPERVQTLHLFEPVLVFTGLRWSVYAKSLPASLPFLPRSWRSAMLEDFGGGGPVDPADPVAAMITDATDHFALKLPLPQQLTREQLDRWTMPVYVALGGRSAMHDPRKAEAVARAHVHQLRLTTWPDGTHSLPMEKPESLDRDALAMMADHDRS